MPNVNEKAPSFTLYDSEGKERRIEDFLEKWKKTILAFFPGAFTSVCTTEMCTFRDMFDELKSLKANLVAISVDSPFSLRAFAEKYGLEFPLLSDFKREAIERYGVLWKDLAGIKGYNVANRAVFILNDSGKIIYKWVGKDPTELPNFEELKQVIKSA